MITLHLNTLISFCLILIDVPIQPCSCVTAGITYFIQQHFLMTFVNFIVFVNLYDHMPLSITCTNFVLPKSIVTVHLYDHTSNI